MFKFLNKGISMKIGIVIAIFIGTILILNFAFGQTDKIVPILSNKTPTQTDRIVPILPNKTPVPPSESSWKRVSAEILDKYTKNVTLRTPDKTICNGLLNNLNDVAKVINCRQNNNSFKESVTPLNFVKIKTNSSVSDCVVQTQQDFDKIDVGKTYNAEIETIKQYLTGPRFVELGEEYCSLVLSGQATIQFNNLQPKLNKSNNIFSSIWNFIRNIFK